MSLVNISIILGILSQVLREEVQDILIRYGYKVVILEKVEGLDLSTTERPIGVIIDSDFALTATSMGSAFIERIPESISLITLIHRHHASQFDLFYKGQGERGFCVIPFTEKDLMSALNRVHL